MSKIIGNLDELISLVHRTARQEELDIIAEANRRAEQTQEEARVAAKQFREELLQRTQQEASSERKIMLARHALAAQHQRIEHRERLIEEVWALAEQQLRDVPTQPGYITVLRSLALRAAAVLHQPTIVLAADAHGHQLLTATRLAEWSADARVQFVQAEAPAAIWGGIIASDSSGRQQVDASFAARLALARQELREAVAAELELL
jgi:vacuolar-type H+-ATPase subunit E/Vma4